MSLLPEDLPRLRTLEIFLMVLLGRVREQIARAEEREAAMRPRQALPAEPGFVLSHLRHGGSPVEDAVHLGDCHQVSGRKQSGGGGRRTPLTREQAVHALTVDGIPACTLCRPDSELGILD
ncbi:DUF6233 domain-containing protein [Streptomyces sp. NPDC048629]|uniref:DUF6233 domain-containing protein n=1 Tax=Streptomyces sp. NPDC048629 TaxID=3154824 RepID=UPI00344ADCB6